jgi:hypothetical protein
MWELVFRDGKVAGAKSAKVSCVVNGHGWQEFLDWNDAQPPEKKLDLSDKPPEPPPKDTAKEAILALLDKDESGTITNAEKLDFCFRVCKRLARSL